MPALNVEFSDDELAALRAAAQDSGKTLKAYVREVVDGNLADRRAQARAAEAFRAFVADNATAFDEAFPDDAPGRSGDGRTSRGAA
ncbi:hypothetical protein LO772_34975 [Yinghuangia sp. ASG 101]|uniref:hypothetical protein n=1 Tax=Yinghuangia sp. ASG 101 TaxID=2896848 RepID=UPI001E5FD3BF|nr:hypothetical protein [Yinghuangia sp. ASG 101]UGQ11906.1 hypothetical protein LO772_34975 [Yinghuangia sp. ASG 101]